MSRFKRIKDWPDCLKRMSSEDLQREHSYWATRIRFLGHPSAKKGAAKRLRDVESELDSREPET